MSTPRSAITLVITLLLFSTAPACSGKPPSTEQTGSGSPLNATYRIDGEQVTLSDGRAVKETVPGAASRTVTKISGAPVSGDLNGDGVADAALLLVQTTGGSGTFYYIAAAINRNGTFEGTEAVFLGDRIAPVSLSIGHSLVIVDYTDRPLGTPMATPPSLERSKYLLFDSQEFREIPVESNELTIAGEVVIGHEVRALQPCGEPEVSWLLGDSPALGSLQVAYHLAMLDASPYSPLFMILTGTLEETPNDGFGADYASAIRVNRVIKIIPGKVCYE